jgi:trimethylamine--corrinoid protein Co-methyltransferase
MNESHTRQHFREVWYHNLVDRKRNEAWIAAGEQTMGDRINQQVKKILETHTPQPLSGTVQELLVQRLREAEEASIAG